ncbi:MAG: NADH:ubiquinone oxidoreductase subunit 5 (subunit L)/multisubunit Na+/H+ antiporter MnhA subunit [Mariniblastus sp.]|jgi:NADH:ubiquinone oxidoreductase subunit 5 (subunit L)/multisubunit Na+/H+ antiporter MnhA subunit
MNLELVYQIFGITTIASPLVLLAVLGVPALVGYKLSEHSIARLIYFAVVIGLLSAIVVLVSMLFSGDRHVPIELGNWINLPEQHFHFHLKFVFDRLSVPFVILTFLLCGTIGAFTTRYLHREQGFVRFYVAYAMFMLGMIFATLAGTIEVLFFGWELVGLSSALLIAFFHERRSPVKNGLMAWCVYRVADAAFLIAAVLMHHLTGAGDFDVLMGQGAWPEGVASITAAQAIIVGLLLIVAAAGKSALVPFSGWLPRAMEGPTSSSAIFYGALSVHLGAFLLLRISPILELSIWLSGTVVILGLLTALYASLAGRVQSDIKTDLAYASLTQVGIITVEIGLGFRYIALIHILGHAALRTLQLLRAPTLLHDYHVLENALDGHLPQNKGLISRLVPDPIERWFYRFALERGYLDELLNRFFVRPFIFCFKLFDSLERRWTNFLGGDDHRESDEVPEHNEIIEELKY